MAKLDTRRLVMTRLGEGSTLVLAVVLVAFSLGWTDPPNSPYAEPELNVEAPDPTIGLRRYPVEILSVVDGDTVRGIIDLGFGLSMGSQKSPELIRLCEIDAPELRKPTRKAGTEAKLYLQAVTTFIGRTEAILDTTCAGRRETGKYGRPVGALWLKTDGGWWVNLNDAMVKSGHAVPKVYR